MALPEKGQRFLYADKGYDGEPVREQIQVRGYIPRVTRKRRRRGRPPKNRRWVVEAAHSWFNRFRKLLVRYEKLVESYEALVHLAAAIICWRKVAPIYG
jgi:transposase